MEPGIYLDLPMDEYLKIDAVSSSALRDIMVSPLKCWERHINPQRRDFSTNATDIGEAIHTSILEGGDFNSRVVPEFQGNDGMLKSHHDFSQVCENRGLPKTGTKKVLFDRLVENGVPRTLFFDYCRDDYNTKHKGKIFLKKDDYDAVNRVFDRVVQSGAIPNIITPKGFSEVSIIWQCQETGMLCKARPDRLENGYMVALKSFSNPLEKPIRQHLAATVYWRKYHIEAAWYMEALRQATSLPIMGDNKDIAPFVRVLSQHFVFLFVETGKVNTVSAYEFAKYSPHTNNTAEQYIAAVHDMNAALCAYVDYLRKYGTNPWIDQCEVVPFDDSDFPYGMSER